MSRPEFLLKVIVRCLHCDNTIGVPVDRPVPPDFQHPGGGTGVGSVFGGGPGCTCRVEIPRLVEFANDVARSGRWGDWRQRYGAVVLTIP
jgi:hypothetical protein